MIRFGSEINHLGYTTPVPEFMGPVFAKTSPKRSFSAIENERLGCFRENWVYKFGHRKNICLPQIKKFQTLVDGETPAVVTLEE